MATNNKDDFSNPLAISQGGTNASSMATADGVVYYDGTRLVTTDAGVAGQLLTSNGGLGSAPTWQNGPSGAPGGQGWDLVQTQTFSGGTGLLSFTGITNAYNNYAVIYSHGGAQEMGIRYSTNGGVSYVSSGYRSTASRKDLSAGTVPPATSNLTYAIINSFSGGLPAYGSVAYLYNVTSGLNCSLVCLGVNNRHFNMCYASFGNALPINALQFVGVGIGFASIATVSLYGINS